MPKWELGETLVLEDDVVRLRHISTLTVDILWQTVRGDLQPLISAIERLISKDPG